MIVKVCGITNVSDALAAARYGATAVGLNFYPGSPRCLRLDGARAIVDALPAQVWKVGLFVDETPERIEETAAALGLDVIQVHGDGGIPAGRRAWKAVRVGPGFTAAALDAGPAEAVLLDTAVPGLHGGTGKTFDWSLARGAAVNIVLAGGLDEKNVRDAIAIARPWGVDACSRLETAPGRKDHARMARFIEAALS